jgi:hypothetical protein
MVTPADQAPAAASQPAKTTFKEKAKHEFEALGLISLYLFVVLSGLGLYKALVLRGYDVSSFEVGYNAVEALVIAKVIMIGGLLKVGELERDEPLYRPTVRKAALYALLVVMFSLLEALLKALFHGSSLAAAAESVVTKERGEVLAQATLMFLALLPFFAIGELARVMGRDRLYELFFRRRSAS